MSDLPAVKHVIAEDPNCIKDSCRNGFPVLHFAILAKEPKIVEVLIHAGIDVNITNKSDDIGTAGETALHLVAKTGALKFAQVLVTAGANVNAKSKSGNTPTHLAAMFQHRDLIELFLEQGADPQVTNNNGESPWDLCPYKSSSESQAIKKLFD